MIKSLREARITDGLPRVVAEQDWVKAMSEALGLALSKTMDYIDGSQIYTNIENAPEDVLDALAVNWKIDWYDPTYSIEQKRRMLQSAIQVRRIAGSAAAVKIQVEAIYPGTLIEEWWQYGGEPGMFRASLNIPDEGITGDEYRRIINGIQISKNVRSHMEIMELRRENTGYVMVGGCTASKQYIEVWPDLVERVEVTGEAQLGGVVKTRRGIEILPGEESVNERRSKR